MSKCSADQMSIGHLGRRVIEAKFRGALSSDVSLMPLPQVDRRIGLSARVARALHDPRDPERLTHSLRDLIAQSLYGLCCGYEDLNDYDVLRFEPQSGTSHRTDHPNGMTYAASGQLHEISGLGRCYMTPSHPRPGKMSGPTW